MPDPAIDRLGNRRCRARRPQPQCPMRPLGVVMGGVYGKYPAQMPLTEDQHPVGDLGPHRQHEAFGEAVRRRTPRRNLDLWVPRTGVTVSDQRVHSWPT